MYIFYYDAYFSQLYVPVPDHVEIVNPLKKRSIKIESFISKSVNFQVSSFQPTVAFSIDDNLK